VAEPLGQLDDLHGGRGGMATLVLSAFVYRTPARVTPVPNHEVRSALWVPVHTLLDPARHVGRRWGLLRLPGILVGEPDRHVVWGLTYQLLEGLFTVVGHPLPRARRR